MFKIASLSIRWLVLTCMLVLATLSSNTIVTGLVEADHEQSFYYIGEPIGVLYADTDQALAELNSSATGSCTEAKVEQMRAMLARTLAIAMIAHVDEAFISRCNTRDGLAAAPIDLSEMASFEAFLNTHIYNNYESPLFPEQTTMLVREGQFLVLVNPRIFNPLSTDLDQWGIHSTLPGSDFNLLGTPIDRPNAPQVFPFSASYKFESCIEGIYVCLRSQSTRMQVWQKHELVIILLLLIWAAIIVFIDRLIVRRQAAQQSETARVRQALSRQAFYFAYQPIVCLRDQKIIGVEVLARHSDSFGALTPDVFIPLIRQQKRTWRFTEYMFSQVTQDLAQHAWPEGFLVNLNFFPEDISTLDVDRLKAIANKLPISVRLGVEITEDALLEHSDAAKNIAALQALGMFVAIDDFGTGYSNLKSLAEISLDKLKIDRSFVEGIDKDSVRSVLVPEMIRLAKSLKLQVVAEGVEREAQRDKLLDLGVEFAQGWLYGKPMSVGELADWINKQKSASLGD